MSNETPTSANNEAIAGRTRRKDDIVFVLGLWTYLTVCSTFIMAQTPDKIGAIAVIIFILCGATPPIVIKTLKHIIKPQPPTSETMDDRKELGLNRFKKFLLRERLNNKIWLTVSMLAGINLLYAIVRDGQNTWQEMCVFGIITLGLLIAIVRNLINIPNIHKEIKSIGDNYVASV